MAKDYIQLTKDISAYLAEMRKAAPDATQGFSALAKGALQDGALSKKTKELMALAIGVSTRCDGCIGFHAKACVDLGATREEVVETLSMCVYLGGGPAYMYVADALRAYDQFVAEKAGQ